MEQTEDRSFFECRYGFETSQRHGRPANIVTQKTTFLPHDSTKSENGRLTVTLSGNRYLFPAPELRDFTLSGDLCFAFDTPGRSAMLYFGYDMASRCGTRLTLSFGDVLSAELARVDADSSAPLETVQLPFTHALREVIPFSLTRKNSLLRCTVGKACFAFRTQVPEAGSAGFGRGGFPGGISFGAFTLSGTCIPCDTDTGEIGVRLPLLRGGALPYRLHWRIRRYGPLTRLDYRLDGGCRERTGPRNGSSYRCEAEWFTDPAIIVITAGRRIELRIWNGKRVLYAPQITNKLLYEYYGACTDEIIGTLFYEGTAETAVGFSFSHFEIDGYHMQSGGAEYLYSPSGEPIYTGDADSDILLRVSSPEEKAICALIDPNLPDYAAALQYARGNHFFLTTEPVILTLTADTRGLDASHISARAEICDAFGQPLRSLRPENRSFALPAPCHTDRTVFTFRPGPSACGVYRVLFTLFHGDTAIAERLSVFEVIDPDSTDSPQQASGLPHLFSTPTEQMYLERDMFDPFQPMPDCISPHFYDISAFRPDAGERKQVWRALSLYRRKWYVWQTSRTVTDWPLENHPEIAAHADFMAYTHARTEDGTFVDNLYLTRLSSYTGDILAALHTFAEAHSLNDVTFDNEGHVTAEGLKNLLTRHACEWGPVFTDICERSRMAVNACMEQEAPGLLRGGYGPFPMYVCFGKTALHCHMYGLRPEKLHSFYTGFCQFEDYPWWGTYRSHMSAWCEATMKLFDPEHTLYPEIFGNTHAYSADGVVRTSNPPFGERMPPEFWGGTQSREYALTCVWRDESGFRYWRDDGFMLRDFPESHTIAFADDWGDVVRHRPSAPLYAPCAVADFSLEETRFDDAPLASGNRMDPVNVSESGVSYIVGRIRESGIPSAYASHFGILRQLKPGECPLVILPSMKYAPAGTAEAVRRLYAEGTALAAVGDVTGLEDLFGVRPGNTAERITLLRRDRSTESVVPTVVKTHYLPDGAQSLLEGDGGTPLLLAHGRTMLLNADVSLLGREIFPERFVEGMPSLSRLLAEAVSDRLRILCEDLPVLGGSGLTVYRDENGRTVLFVVNYANEDPAATNERTTLHIRLNGGWTAARSRLPVTQLRRDGKLCGIGITLLPEQSAVITLE